ncbi:hypothetical protein [Bacillus mexicanus]|uniref:hypothetical protein n=1 Tax=Bacillus mexicanus TaxID=2834415 RepID=UPI003D1D69F3
MEQKTALENSKYRVKDNDVVCGNKGGGRLIMAYYILELRNYIIKWFLLFEI